MGALNELVTLGGVVWEPPTSCAWASRVHVCHDEARAHGVAHVGLPSRHAHFSRGGGAGAVVTVRERERAGAGAGGVARRIARRLIAPWRRRRPKASEGGGDGAGGHRGGAAGASGASVEHMAEVATFHGVPQRRSGLAAGPRISMSLPSFSGLTQACPQMLRYAVRLNARVRPAKPARVSVPSEQSLLEAGISEPQKHASAEARRALCGIPLLALVFEDMTMVCGQPKRIADIDGQRTSVDSAKLAAATA